MIFFNSFFKIIRTWFEKFSFFTKKNLGRDMLTCANHDYNMSSICYNILDIFFNSCFKNNNLIFHKNWERGGVAMATMIIWVKHFFNIPDIFCLILALKIVLENGLDLKNFHFSQTIWKKICCHGNHDNMCKTFFKRCRYFL